MHHRRASWLHCCVTCLMLSPRHALARFRPPLSCIHRCASIGAAAAAGRCGAAAAGLCISKAGRARLSAILKANVPEAPPGLQALHSAQEPHSKRSPPTRQPRGLAGSHALGRSPEDLHRLSSALGASRQSPASVAARRGTWEGCSSCCWPCRPWPVSAVPGAGRAALQPPASPCAAAQAAAPLPAAGQPAREQASPPAVISRVDSQTLTSALQDAALTPLHRETTGCASQAG